MAGLTRQDLDILLHYAEQGNRGLYWHYLANQPGSDGYAALTLDALRHNSQQGMALNHYLILFTSMVKGTDFTELDQEQLDIALMVKDLNERRKLVAQGKNLMALNLPVEQVIQSHQEAFELLDIDPDGWFANIWLKAARKRNQQAAQQLWLQLIHQRGQGIAQQLATQEEEEWLLDETDFNTADHETRLKMAWRRAARDRRYHTPWHIAHRHRKFVYHNKNRMWYEECLATDKTRTDKIAVNDAFLMAELNTLMAQRQMIEILMNDPQYRHPHDYTPSPLKSSVQGYQDEALQQHQRDHQQLEQTAFKGYRLTPHMVQWNEELSKTVTPILEKNGFNPQEIDNVKAACMLKLAIKKQSHVLFASIEPSSNQLVLGTENKLNCPIIVLDTAKTQDCLQTFSQLSRHAEQDKQQRLDQAPPCHESATHKGPSIG